MPFKVLFAGTPDLAVETLNALVETDHEVVGVLTREDAPQGRKRVLTPSAVAQRGEELELPVIKANQWSEAVAEEVKKLQADIAAVVAFGAILPPAALDLLPHGWINLHFSSLPQWRGAAPVQRALMAGESEIFSNVFRIESGLDTGPVFREESTGVGPTDTAGEILVRLARSGGSLLNEAFADIEVGGEGIPQSGEPTHAAKLSLEDGRLDWNLPKADILARYRGVTPEPGAWCTFNDARFKVGELALADATPAGPVGTVHLVNKKPVVTVCDGTVELIKVQPAGKKMMNAADWARGLGSAVAEQKVVLS